MNPSEMSDEQLVRAVLIEVMNRPELSNDEYVAEKSGFYITTYGRVFILCPEKEEFYPLHRPDHWWLVMERMRELKWLVSIHDNYGEGWFIWYKKPHGGPKPNPHSQHKEIGRAVLEASLLAKRWKEGR